MKYQVIAHEHIFESEKFFSQCHASTLVILENDVIACAWFGGKHEKSSDCSIWFSKRENRIWSDPIMIASGDGIPCWNPVLLYDENKLKLFYKVGNEIPQWQTMVKESIDGGITWTEQRELVEGDFGGRGPVKNKCIKLNDGSIIAPASIETDEKWECFTDRSTDNGNTWQKSKAVPMNFDALLGKGAIQPTLWQDDKNVIHMLIRSSEGAILKSVSTDNGDTWSQAVRTSLPNNNCGIDIVKTADNRLVLVYNPISGNWAKRSPIAFCISNDNGQSFSEPQILDYVPCEKNIEAAEFSYPAIVSKDNDIYITYTWKRRTIAFWQIRLGEKPKRQDKINDGVWVTMITPFTKDNKVDYDALEALIEWYISKNVDGLFAVCQSSEMFFLNAYERAEIARFTVEKVAGRVQVVASGHVSDNINDQIEELKATAKSGASAVVLVSNRLAKENENDSIWKANAQKILDAIPNCDFGIYECPYPYKRLVSPELLNWCAKTGRFTFLKDTSCNINQIKAKLDAVKGMNLKIFNANSATILESLRAGANGFCGVMANFHPELYVKLTQTWNDDRQKSEKIQNFATIASLAELQTYPINAKYHLSLCGVKISLQTRSKDCTQWNDLRETETMALLSGYNDFVSTI